MTVSCAKRRLCAEMLGMLHLINEIFHLIDMTQTFVNTLTLGRQQHRHLVNCINKDSHNPVNHEMNYVYHKRKLWDRQSDVSYIKQDKLLFRAGNN